MTFYDVFERLCSERGVTPTKAARDVGIAQPVVSQWKKRGSTPKFETILALARYFDVPITKFYTKPSDIDDTVEQLLETVRLEFPDDEGIKRTLAEIEQQRKKENNSGEWENHVTEMPLALDASDIAFLREIGDLSESDKALLLAMAKRLREAGREGSAAIQTSKGPYYLYSYPQEPPLPSPEGKNTTPPSPPPESPENDG